MSPLCRSSNQHKNLASKRPSPTNAGVAFPALDGTTPESNCIEEISLFTSKRTGLNGSMTVEAAIVIPLLLFFLLNLGSLMEIIRLHGNVELALTNVGNELSLYQYIQTMELSEQEQKALPEGMKALMQSALTQVYIQQRIESYLGEDYLEEAPIVSKNGWNLSAGWNVLQDGDYLELRYSYAIGCPFEIPGFKDFYMCNSYYSHVWNGYQIPGSEDGVGTETVFLTEYGEVYHNSMECHYLQLSIRELTWEEAKLCTNITGNRYELCSYCEDLSYCGVVYVTDYGECFHYSLQCEGLKRTIYSVTLKEAESLGLRLCSKCGKGSVE